jgi:endonuclease/exonuclease/phosphatase family metal-dependent hydrolase
MTSIRRRTIVLFAALVTLAALLSPGPAQAKSKRELTVMTQNLYLGASLTPAIAATSEAEFVEAVATIYGTVLFTDFPTRSEQIAAEIRASGADIIGLQEVSDWTVLGGVGDVPSLDFLNILMSDLGPDYSVAAVSYNAALGPFPLALPGTSCEPIFVPEAPPIFPCGVQFEDRDVIVVKDNPALEVTGSAAGNFDEQVVLSILGQPLSFDRGWALIDGTFEGKKFRFVNTHLETEDWPAEQEAQAAEFLAGPAKAGGAVIAVGDFNSAADGSTTTSYRTLTKSYFDDAWDVNPGNDGLTCCQNGTLTNFPSALESRIDLVLTHAAARTLSAEVVGDEPFQGAPPLWPSDHAGVVAVIRIH